MVLVLTASWPMGLFFFWGGTAEGRLETQRNGTAHPGGIITLDQVPRTGPMVEGAAAIHEHLMAEHAFSGKWHWGSVEGPEASALESCDGDGNTHGGSTRALLGARFPVFSQRCGTREAF